MWHASRFIGTRLLLALGTILLVSVAIFVAAEVLPSDPAVAALGRESTPEQRDAFRERANLDDPPAQRYLAWVGGVATGDFGESAITGRAVGPELKSRSFHTTLLALLSLLAGTVIALPLMLRAARRPGGAVDTVTSVVSVAVVATPEFVLAMGALFLLAVQAGVFPVVSTGVASGDWVGVVLPALTLSLGVAAYVFRTGKGAVEDTLRAPYVRSGLLHGFSRRRIVWRHVMPNAGIVIVNAIALNAIYLVGGVIVVETVFSYPGLGRLLVSAINDGDIVLIEGIGVVMAALFVFINLVADALVLVLNPKLRVRS
jgi:peptide/nickel transport system permease protein